MHSLAASTIVFRQRKTIDSSVQHQLLQLLIDGNNLDQICGFFFQLHFQDPTILGRPVTRDAWDKARRRLYRQLKESQDKSAFLNEIERQTLWHQGLYCGDEIVRLGIQSLMEPLCCRYYSWKKERHVHAEEAMARTISMASHQGAGHAPEEPSSNPHPPPPPPPLPREIGARQSGVNAGPLVEHNVSAGLHNNGFGIPAFAPESYSSEPDPICDEKSTSKDIDQENDYKSFMG